MTADAWISTTIKRMYMDKILSGEKTVEYKSLIPYWDRRVGKFLHKALFANSNPPTLPKGINFLCGRKSYKFKITMIRIEATSPDIPTDVVSTGGCYAIHLGERIE